MKIPTQNDFNKYVDEHKIILKEYMPYTNPAGRTYSYSDIYDFFANEDIYIPLCELFEIDPEFWNKELNNDNSKIPYRLIGNMFIDYLKYKNIEITFKDIKLKDNSNIGRVIEFNKSGYDEYDYLIKFQSSEIKIISIRNVKLKFNKCYKISINEYGNNFKLMHAVIDNGIHRISYRNSYGEVNRHCHLTFTGKDANTFFRDGELIENFNISFEEIND